MLLSWWWLQTPALAATKVFLKSSSSQFMPPAGWNFRLASTTQGSSSQGCTTSSVAGPVTGQYFPGNATGHLATCAGAKLAWFTPPLASGVTIAGTITPNLWGLESATQCNCGLRYEVLRWDVRQGGIVSSLGKSADNGLTEWGTSAAVRTTPTLAPSSTGFNAGDRIVIVIYNDDASGTTQSSGRNWTLNHDGPAGANGDTYLSFTETLSFSSDSNNARPQGIFSLLLEPLAWWKEFFDQAFA